MDENVQGLLLQWTFATALDVARTMTQTKELFLLARTFMEKLQEMLSLSSNGLMNLSVKRSVKASAGKLDEPEQGAKSVKPMTQP